MHRLHPARLATSIEVSARQALESADLLRLFPKGIRVYLPDLGGTPDQLLVAAACRLTDLGFIAVPHIAARRLASVEALDTKLKSLSEEAGVKDVLLIAGGVSKPEGAFASSMSALETGLFDRHGITSIGVAGHPEGSPDFSTSISQDVLRSKAAFAERTGARMRIVTQFGFDGERFVQWARELQTAGIDLPIHFGIAGPAKLSTLVKYAVTCGVGNSLTFLRKRAMNLAALATNQSPEEVVEPIERYALSTPDTNVRQLHIFTFGGLRNTADWLHERGSWWQAERQAS